MVARITDIDSTVTVCVRADQGNIKNVNIDVYEYRNKDTSCCCSCCCQYSEQMNFDLKSILS